MNSTPDTRYSLIGKLQDSQDAEAWEEFTNIYQPLIFRLCISKGLQYADATDVTQEVLARVADTIGRFDGGKKSSSFRGWLYRITRNLVIDFFRHRQKNLLLQSDRSTHFALEMEPTPEESAEFYLEFQQQVFRAAVQAVQSQVQPATWQAFWQTEIEQRPVTDVARELDMNHGAVYMARSRVFTRLKNAVEQRLHETHEG